MKPENFLIASGGYRDVNPLVCGQQLCDPGHSFGPASREYYLLHYVVSGKGTLFAEGLEYPIRAGECFVIRPYELTLYTADTDDPWHYIWVGFTCSLNFAPLQTERAVTSTRLGTIFRQMTDLRHIKSGRESFLCAKIWELLSVLQSLQVKGEEQPEDYVRIAVSCMESEYMMELSISSLAKRLNLNRSYFSTLFKKQTGVSPQRYLNDFRLEKAAKLLTEYHYSATEAAHSTGYPDVFAFSRMFKRKFGVSPSLYKKDAGPFE